MSDSVKARPVWASKDSTREDDKCAHRIQVHGSAIRFIRCGREKAGEYAGFPVCRSHMNKLEAA